MARWAEVGGWTEAGGAPHPLSCFPPLWQPITRQAPAPGAASRGPATPKRRVFAGKKSEQLAARRQRWPSGRSGSHARPRGVRATHAAPSPSPAGPGAQAGSQAGERIGAGRRGERPGGPGCQPGPGRPGARGAETLPNSPERPGTRGQHGRTRAPAPGAALHASRALPSAPPALGSRSRRPGARAGRADHPRGRAGVAPAGWGRARRAAGEDVRLRACARGAPRFNCRARARFRAPFVPRARLDQWGASGAGRPGAAQPMSEAAQVKGGGPWRAGPLGRSRRWGWAWARWRGPRGWAGAQEGLRGRGSGVGGRRVGRGAEVSGAARAGPAGTGRPVAMATAGPAASRTRARGRTPGGRGLAGPGWGPPASGPSWLSSPGLLKLQPAPDFWVSLWRQYSSRKGMNE